jgi:superfamily II DNA or RNA helicase
MEKGFLAKLAVEIILLKHPHQKFDTYNDEIEWLGLCEYRNKFISNLASDLKGNVLVLFARVEKHGIPLHEMIDNSTDRPTHLVYGMTDVKEREKVREVCETSDNNIIVASYGVFSTGVNIKNLNHIVFASPSKSKVRVLQSIGKRNQESKGKR